MQSEPIFMYGDPDQLLAEPARVMTVLLIGFDGRRLVLTGTREAIWREFKSGDGGPGCNGVWPIGWQYWCPQPLGIADRLAAHPENITPWEVGK